MASKKIEVAVAWPYVYAPFHIGNLYGSFLPADFFGRFHRVCGNEVLMVSGSDCFGTPIALKAEELGIKPEELAEKFHLVNKKILETLKVEMTLYTATSTKNHEEVVQQMFLDLLEQGYIISKKTKQLYSEEQGRFMQDRYVEGECPHCHSDRARGDQCDSCGKLLDSLEIINPTSKIDGSTLIVKETENYFIDLSSLQPEIEKWIQSKEGTFRTWVYKETMGWIKDGLLPRAITRDIDYGVAIPVDRIPEDKKIEDIDKKVFYVWFEAVIGYLSASVEYSKDIGNEDYWKDFYLDPEAEAYHYLGEDNIVFHTINWPAQLMATGRGYTLPANVFASKFLLLEGDKFSKSRNWVIDTEYLLENYPIDSLRFYLAYIATRDDQTNFYWKDFFNVNNGVLSAKIGNLIHRVITFTAKNFGEQISDTPMECDKEVKDMIERTYAKTKEKLEGSYIRETVLDIIELAEFGNEYLTKHEFWKLVKEDKEACKQVVYSALCLINALRDLLYPFVPGLVQGLHANLGYEGEYTTSVGEDHWVYKDFPVSNILNKDAKPLVEQLDMEKVDEEVVKLGS